MNEKIEVLPVTADEVTRLLSSLTMKETEKLLDDIKMAREDRTFNKILVLVSTPKNKVET